MPYADIKLLENDQLRSSMAELQSAVEASKKQVHADGVQIKHHHAYPTRVVEQLKGLLETRDCESRVRREQLFVLEKTIEQLKKAEAVESHRTELEDHKCRADTLERQVKSKKKFLEEQLAEREQERLEFEQECKRLLAFHQDHERQEIAKQRLFREELEKLAADQTDRLNEMEEQDQAQRQQIAQLQKQSNNLRDQLDSEKETFTQLLLEKTNLEKTLLKHQKSDQELSDRLNNLKQETREKEHLIAELQQKLHTKDAASKEKIVRFEEKVVEMENNILQQVAMTKDLKKQLEETVEAKAEAKRVNQGMEQELPCLKLELRDLKDVRRSIEEDNKNLQVQVQDQLKQIFSLCSQVDEMKLMTNKSLDDAKELTRLRQILDGEKQSMDAKDEEINDLNRQIAEQLEHDNQLSAQIEALSEAVNDEKGEALALFKVLQEKEKLMEFSKSKVHRLQNESRTLMDSYTQLKFQYEQETKRLGTEVADKQNIIDTGVEELMLLQTEASNSDHEISVYKRQLEQTKGVLEARNLEIKHLYEEIEYFKKKMVNEENELKAISGRLQMTMENENVLSQSLGKKEEQIAKMNLRLFKSEDAFKRMQTEMEEKIEEQANFVIEPLRLAVKQKERNIWQLQQTIDRLHKKQAIDLAEVEKRYVDCVASMKKNLTDDSDAELREILMEHAERLAGLKNTFDDESENMRMELEGRHTREVLVLQERAECERKLQEEKHAKELEVVSRQHEVEMEEVTRKHAEKLAVVAEQLQFELEDRLQRLQELHSEEMNKFEEHYGQCLKKAEQSYCMELEKTKEVLSTERETELADLKVKHRFELHQLKSDLEERFEECVNQTLFKEWQGKMEDEIDRLTTVAKDQQKEFENHANFKKSKHADHISRLRSAWQKEKDSLDRENTANRQLIQAFGVYLQTAMKGKDVDDVDWRGDLYRSVHSLISAQTAATLAERCSNAVLFENAQDSVDLLEKSISEQDLRHNNGLEEILSIDRQSMLAENAELKGQIRILQQKVLDDNQQMTQKLTDLETQFDRKEKRFKRQLSATETRLAEEIKTKERILSDLEQEKAKASDLVDVENETREFKNKLESKQCNAEEYKAHSRSQVKALESRLAKMEEKEQATEEELENERQINEDLVEQVDALNSELEYFKQEHDCFLW